jgi:nitric oxide reductase subunit B
MPRSKRSPLVVPQAWIQVALLTFVVGFAILGYLAYRVYADHPPVPREAVATDGKPLFSRHDVFRGQMVFEKYGLMEYGTIFGHGAYLGPDFTADYIERSRVLMRQFYAASGTANPDAHIVDDFKINRWDAASDVLTLTPAQVAAGPNQRP